MNWKEEFDMAFENYYDILPPSEQDMDAGSEVEHYQRLKNFISTKIIEKLIADIPNKYGIEMEGMPLPEDLTNLKQQLRNKWL